MRTIIKIMLLAVVLSSCSKKLKASKTIAEKQAVNLAFIDSSLTTTVTKFDSNIVAPGLHAAAHFNFDSLVLNPQTVRKFLYGFGTITNTFNPVNKSLLTTVDVLPQKVKVPATVTQTTQANIKVNSVATKTYTSKETLKQKDKTSWLKALLPYLLVGVVIGIVLSKLTKK